MKKSLLFLVMILFAGALSAQDILTGWSFPVNTGTDSLNANVGLTQNKSYDLRFQWVTPNDTTINSIFFTDGSTSYAAATTGWDNGMENKYWSIKFKANGYQNIKVSSLQRSGYASYAPGPGEFKIQWRLSGGTYADIPDGAIHVADDWTTGKIENLLVPVTDQGSTSIYLRWISNSNNDYQGNPLTANGISMIDEILVTGTSTAGTEDILFTNRINVSPVPNHGTFTVNAKAQVKSLAVCDMNGRILYTTQEQGTTYHVALGSVSKGTYFLKVVFVDNDEKSYSMKILVD